METRVCKNCGRELPIENFKLTRWGDRVHVCTECANAKMRENKAAKKEREAKERERQIEERRQLKLCDFSPRELMNELARRGYTGKLQYTKIVEIDIQNF